MARHCLVCSSPRRAAIDAVIAAGSSDRQIATQFGIERVSIGRHRRRHLLKAAQDRLAILAKGADARQERQELAAAASADEPPIEQLIQATIGMRALLREWNDIVGQLRRTSNGAEQSGQLTAVAALAGQRYRGLEFAARLAGISGFTPPAHVAGQPGETSRFVIEMVFPHAQEQHLTINGKFAGDDTGLANPSAPAGRAGCLIIEGEPDADEGMPEDQAP